MIAIESATRTDIGKKRQANEDAYYYDDELALYVVADGMGGHNAGEVASKIVADTFRHQMRRFAGNLDAEQLMDDDLSMSVPARRLNATTHIANGNILAQARKNPAHRGMGTTLSAVYFLDGTLIAVNVGDSPIYFIRNGRIELLSVPHTMIAEYEAMAPKGAKPLSRRYRHVITRALGLSQDVQPDFKEVPCLKNDQVVICSDGLSDKVSPEDIRVIVNQVPVAPACKALVDLANARGGDDNITVIILKVVDI